MAWRDLVSNWDLLRYLGEVHDILVYFLEVEHSNVIEEFLDEYNEEFTEWVKTETEEGADD